MAAYCEGATTDLAAEALAIDLRAVRETDMAATGVCDAWGGETEADRQGKALAGSSWILRVGTLADHPSLRQANHAGLQDPKQLPA